MRQVEMNVSEGRPGVSTTGLTVREETPSAPLEVTSEKMDSALETMSEITSNSARSSRTFGAAVGAARASADTAVAVNRRAVEKRSDLMATMLRVFEQKELTTGCRK